MAHTLDLIRHLSLFAVLVVALYTDLAQGRVENACAYGGIALGLILHTLAAGWGSGGIADCLRDPDAAGLANALLGGGAAFALFFPFFWAGGFGGGDLKLMTAVGTLSGLCVTLTALVLTAAAGAAMAVGLLILKGRLAEGLKGSWGILRRLGRPAPAAGGAERLTLRYVPAIAIGTTWAWYLQHAR